MERVIFVVEGTGERISCLLNPETLVFRRQAGLRTRAEATGVLTGYALSDDPIVATGGGRTEFDLDLLFDVAIAEELNPIAEPGPVRSDVRDLTRPIWSLAENAPTADRYGGPATIRFIWGRSWNVLAVVTAVTERLERFTPEGEPQRSWMRLRLRRLSETAVPAASSLEASPVPPLPEAAQQATSVEVAVDPAGMPQLRLDQLASAQYGDPSYWRLIAAFNGVADPFDLPEGTVLRVPSPAEIRPE